MNETTDTPEVEVDSEPGIVVNPDTLVSPDNPDDRSVLDNEETDDQEKYDGGEIPRV